MKSIITTILIALTFGCASTAPEVKIQNPGPSVDMVSCTDACVRLKYLGCQMGKWLPGQDGLIGTDDDTGCLSDCFEGWYARFDTKCVANADTCYEAQMGCRR